jgi:hypothetical protein
MIPLAGQGKPLPPGFPQRGEWLLENRMFLCRPDEDRSPGGGRPQFTASGPSPDGGWCVGFDAAELASALDVEVELIFEANRKGALVLARTEDVPPTYGGAGAKLYVFRLGERQAGLTIEAVGQGGRA